jgi:4-nitrophenyl phosphatase
MCQTSNTSQVFPPKPTTYIFDMDGVVNLGDFPIPGAADAISKLQLAGRAVYFLTNNSSRSRAHYEQKLAGFGVSTEKRFIVTSAYATAMYLASHGGAGKTVFVVGEHGLAEELESVGLTTVITPDAVPYTHIDYVAVGIDRAFTYDKLRYAHAAVTRGHAELIATNRDSTYPTEDGEIPGGGSIVAAVATAVGREPLNIGKPEPFGLELILRDAGASIDQAVVVGDRLDTDIAAGNRLGVATILVLTGVTTREMVASATNLLWRPTRIVGTLQEILEDIS